eukprot:6208331-Pleurochrysis_carterae.AAC.2
MSCGPIRIRKTVKRFASGGDVAKANAFVVRQVHKDATSSIKELGSGTAHGSTQHANRPREERSLPPAASLGHAVDGLFNAADSRAAVGSVGGVARRGMTVHDLSRLEVPLQVGRDEIPAAHAHVSTGSDGGECPQGRGPHGRAVGLVVVHPLDLRTALHAKARLERTAALAFVYPDETHN